MGRTSLFSVDLTYVISEVQELQRRGKSEEAIILELCGQCYNGVQSNTIEDVKLALSPSSWEYNPHNLNSRSE